MLLIVIGSYCYNTPERKDALGVHHELAVRTPCIGYLASLNNVEVLPIKGSRTIKDRKSVRDVLEEHMKKLISTSGSKEKKLTVRR